MTFDPGELDQDHEMLRQMVRDLVAAEVAPGAAARDAAGEPPSDLATRLGPLGLLGVLIPEDCGGAGMGHLALALTVEELAAGDASVALAAAVHNALGAAHVLRCGDDAQRARWLPALASGEIRAAWAGFDGDVRAEADGDGWRLTGRVPLVPGAAGADRLVVVAETEAGERATFFLTARAAGLSVEPAPRPLGLRAAGLADVRLDAVRAAAADRLAEAQPGALLPAARVAFGALSVGLGRAAMDAAARYAADRRQFDRPIADFQAVQFMLADGFTALDATRLAVWQAARDLDAGRPAGPGAAMARLLATDAAARACDAALQIHGGYGYTREYPVERCWRDAKQASLLGEPLDALRREIAAHVAAAAPDPAA